MIKRKCLQIAIYSVVPIISTSNHRQRHIIVNVIIYSEKAKSVDCGISLVSHFGTFSSKCWPHMTKRVKRQISGVLQM